MSMIDWLFGFWRPGHRGRLQGLAELLAMESRPAVWSRLLPRAGQLDSIPEAEGYIRVRARELVRGETAGAARRCPWLSLRHQQQVQEQVLAMLVSHFIGPMMRTQRVVVPLRRAA